MESPPPALFKSSLALFLIFATLFTFSRVAVYEQAGIADKSSSIKYSYRGRDFPPTWPVGPLPPAHLTHEDSVHYAIDTPLGIAEWNATLPSGGTVVHLGPDLRPFTVSFFHQLRCLDIIRDVLVTLDKDPSPNAQPKNRALAQHCMNYLRETTMCRGDLHLEAVRASDGNQITVSTVTHLCKNWQLVYEAAEENYRMLLSRRNDPNPSA